MSATLNRWMRHWSLAGKIVVVTMGVTSAALLLASGGLMAYDSAAARTSFSRDIGMLAEVVGATSQAAVSFGDAAAATETLHAVAVNQSVRSAAIEKDGLVIARFDRTGAPSGPAFGEFLATLPADADTSSTFTGDALRVVRPIVFDNERLGRVVIESGLDDLHERQRRLVVIMALVVLSSLVVAFVLSYRLQRVISAPVLRLTEVTREVSRNKNYDVRVAKGAHDEVGVLIDGFNEMLTEIQRRDRQLVEHQDALEREVAHRTLDLRAANTDLLAARDKAMAGSRAKSEFLANMSHEIRTPMNGIIGMTELALDSTMTAEQRDCLTTVKSSAVSLLSLLNDILDFSKIESQKLDLESIPLSVSEVVDDTLKQFAILAHKKGLELIADVSPDVPSLVNSDPGRLGQILANLVGNALKFTPQGRVVVQVRCAERTSTSADLIFSVADTGIGISPAQQTSIFEAFSQADGSTTRRFGGTGLGLTISSSLVRLMGGRLWVESGVGQGSTFLFAVTFSIAEAEPATPGRDPLLTGVPVLVVDDDLRTRRVLCDMLERWAMKATPVDGAAAALRLLDRGTTPFRVVLVDANMPEVDGFALAEQITEQDLARGVRLVMMLATSGGFADVGRCQQLGVAAHVSKPLRQTEVVDAIRRALRPEGVAATMQTIETAATGVRKKHVLLAEDNLVNQQVAVGLLSRRGHTVDVVGNGVEALAAWEAGTYDVILMDIQMPEMGGVEATRAIREREALTGRHTRIVAMTAHAMKGDREEYLGAGMDGYVSKPVDHKALMAEIECEDAPAAVADVERPVGGVCIAIAELRERLGGDDQLVRGVVAAFLEDLPNRLDAIDRALAAHDVVAIRAAAHDLKGAAANVSAAALAECAHSLEIVAHGVQFDRAAAEAAQARLDAWGRQLIAAGPSLSAPADQLCSPTAGS